MKSVRASSTKYPMWPIAELLQIDGECRKIMKENGGYHPLETMD